MRWRVAKKIEFDPDIALKGGARRPSYRATTIRAADRRARKRLRRYRARDWRAMPLVAVCFSEDMQT